MKTLSLVMAGLLTFAAAGVAAGGAGGTAGAASGTSGAVGGGGGGHAGSGVSAAHVSGGFVGASHMAVGAGGGYRSTGLTGNGLRASSGSVGTFGRSSGYLTSPGAPMRVLPTMPTVHNAWSDPVSPRVAGTSNTAYSHNTSVYGEHLGQNLYPGAAGYSAANARPANGYFHHGHNGENGARGYHRYYYNNFPYPVYYPYLYGGIGYDGAVGDYTGLTADNGVADLGAPDFSTTPNAYYNYVAPTQPQNAPDADQAAAAPSQQPLPEAPAVGPQGPSTAAKSPDHAQQGPDSLVEAVQEELGKRGYFAGKPDAVYGNATKEAIRRFQADQKLPITGRINEATLHALNLD